MTDDRMEPMPRRRRRFGCVGCLTQSVLLFVVAGLAILGAQRIFVPWAFRLGGTFRPIAIWQGVAHLHAASGDYVLSVWLTPSSGSRLSNFPTFGGGAYLCTPRGEGIPLRMYAVIPEHVSGETNGKPMRIELHHRSWFGSTSGVDGRPRLTFHGRWQDPDLVMDDGGTLSTAFLPDGRLYDGPAARQPHATQTLSVVFHEVPWTTWRASCR